MLTAEHDRQSRSPQQAHPIDREALAREQITELRERPNGLLQPLASFVRWELGRRVRMGQISWDDVLRDEVVDSAVASAMARLQEQGEPIGLLLARIDDWTDAWAQSITMFGDPYVIMQMPSATSPHGTAGVTMLINQRDKRWSFLYGFDRERAVPTRYPAWSFASIWGRTFAGVPGGVAEVDMDTFELQGSPLPFVVRSGHIDKFGPSRVDNLRIRIKRGVGQAAGRAPQIGLRVNRDNKGFGQWVWRALGTEGQREMVIYFGGQGSAHTWQWEMRVTDPVDVQFVSMQIQVERLGW